MGASLKSGLLDDQEQPSQHEVNFYSVFFWPTEPRYVLANTGLI